jgi:hypothetical protein
MHKYVAPHANMPGYVPANTKNLVNAKMSGSMRRKLLTKGSLCPDAPATIQEFTEAYASYAADAQTSLTKIIERGRRQRAAAIKSAIRQNEVSIKVANREREVAIRAANGLTRERRAPARD